MISRRTFVASGALLFAAKTAAQAQQTMILFCAAALQSSVEPLIGEFEKSGNRKVSATYQIINEITERLRKGDLADLAIVSAKQWDNLNKEGKLDPAVRVVIARVGYGVFVKRGSGKPAISSVEAFKRAFLNARSITFPSGSGPIRAYETRVFEQLGISAEVTPKFKYNQPAQRVAGLFQLVANGDAEIGLATTAEILEGSGIDFAGPVPDALQSLIAFTTVIPHSAKDPAAAKDFIRLLTSPSAAALMKSKGFQPGESH